MKEEYNSIKNKLLREYADIKEFKNVSDWKEQ